MADRSPLFLLLIFWTLSTGVFGAGDTHVFSRSGETVHLPCTNTVQHCRPSETDWIYSSYRRAAADELIYLGEKHIISERLNLGSDCSLTISRVTTEDAGRYICQQWRGDQKQGPDSHVYLHVVAVSVSSSSSSSSSSSDIGPGLSLTLSCRLFIYFGFFCDGLLSSQHLHLSWVNEAGVDLNTDSRYQISSTGCIISLSTTLISEDEDKQWRCGVYQRNQLKTSDTFTVHYSAPDPIADPLPAPVANPLATTKSKTTTTTAATPDHNTNPETEKPRAASPAGAQTTAAETPDHNTTSPESSSAVSVIVAVVAVFALLFSAFIVRLIHNRLADDEEEDCDFSLLTSVVFSETPAEHMWKRMKYSV
ncbi:uncharacterized protein im:7142016 isoform X2 [Danio rerio]|uniref:Uncharacterized protein im:7142016 isoform X2 n=1 Tax=Danio rerio TaxID=7955 RepID=A0AC58J044_DANRE|nr:uncharacterized protein im:7142016 [Danio rerio]|eukprot:XP_021326583.1 uncharacterized protein im:7142016 [Danio rerio]